MKKILAEIKERISHVEERPGLCLYYAHHTASVLHEHGLPVVIQAGSLQWPRILPEEDDGKMDTHFAYMWSPGSPESQAAVLQGNLPECHVWVGILNRQELVDFSTGHLRAAAESRGMVWTAADPPSYVWCNANDLPDWVVYRPCRDATIYVCSVLRTLFDPAYLRRSSVLQNITQSVY